jgi:hypothetical protein
MNYADLVAACDLSDSIDLIVHRPWRGQRQMKLLPGARVKGTPIERLPQHATLVRFVSAEVKREIEPFVKLEALVKANALFA